MCFDRTIVFGQDARLFWAVICRYLIWFAGRDYLIVAILF